MLPVPSVSDQETAFQRRRTFYIISNYAFFDSTISSPAAKAFTPSSSPSVVNNVVHATKLENDFPAILSHQQQQQCTGRSAPIRTIGREIRFLLLLLIYTHSNLYHRRLLLVYLSLSSLHRCDRDVIILESVKASIHLITKLTAQ